MYVCTTSFGEIWRELTTGRTADFDQATAEAEGEICEFDGRGGGGAGCAFWRDAGGCDWTGGFAVHAHTRLRLRLNGAAAAAAPFRYLPLLRLIPTTTTSRSRRRSSDAELQFDLV